MKLTNNTVLITGGSAGIGLALSKQLLAQNNTVIICGRGSQKLEVVKRSHPKIHTRVCDVSDDTAIKAMVASVIKDFPSLNVLINNAGLMHIHDIANNSLALSHQKNEIQTNFYGVVALCDSLIGHLKKQDNAAIINISSGLAYMPFLAAPVYTATKAAVHSYSQSIRQALKGTSIKVIEALPPMVETDMSKGLEMEGMNKISPEKLADIIIKQVQKGKLEIRPGASAMMIRMYKLFPWMINAVMGKMAPKILLNIPKY